ncbi:MAG TPA: putative DNA modification/repair radical SAM protein [Verrucomicrobia bacterium]|nr:MAG: putative DNA modification/repair radical SAM protein [Lentisphaerae bacterium GWF2_57_35]HBA85700.1 putative DNA modification/repair radical SAM protein [Verrucomicrobiota bacterium]
MTLQEKIGILGAAARYDASCASSGSRRSGDVGRASVSGICHSWADDGRCISLLKILLSNCCIYDCAYCINRRSNDVPRASFTAEELADLTIQFYRRNYIEGLFLSSAVFGSPDLTMEQMIRVVMKLRRDHRFGGYIHMKAIPGANPDLIRRAGLLVDRLSVNIELPSEQSLKQLAPDKSKDDILKPMTLIKSGIVENRAERKQSKKAPHFVPAGQSTQLIVGASPESDRHILNLSENLYQRYQLKRVYYSAFVPVNEDGRLPTLAAPPLVREHRLYQADWLIRKYGFEAEEVLPEQTPFLDEQFDPKTAWALRNLQAFPVEVNRAEFEQLLRVPGIGHVSAQRILASRRISMLRVEDLPKLGVVMKRARFFVTCSGAYAGAAIPRGADLRRLMLAEGPAPASSQQLTLAGIL